MIEPNCDCPEVGWTLSEAARAIAPISEVERLDELTKLGHPLPVVSFWEAGSRWSDHEARDHEARSLHTALTQRLVAALVEGTLYAQGFLPGDPPDRAARSIPAVRWQTLTPKPLFRAAVAVRESRAVDGQSELVRVRVFVAPGNSISERSGRDKLDEARQWLLGELTARNSKSCPKGVLISELVQRFSLSKSLAQFAWKELTAEERFKH